MKKWLFLMVIMSVLLVSCIRIGSAAPAGRVPDKVPDVTGGMAQNPGELQSLPGAQPGNPEGLPSLPAGQSASAPISQFGSTSSQPSSSGSSMGELQGLQGRGQSGGLPALQGGGQSGSLPGLTQPSSPSSLPAGVPVSPNMAGLKGGSQASQQDNTGSKPWLTYGNGPALVADKGTINPGEAVLLQCLVEGATSVTVTDSEGRKFDVPVNKRGLFVVPMRTTTYTMVASNSRGSLNESVTVFVTFEPIAKTYAEGKVQAELTTLAFSRSSIRRGESTWLFWNTRNAEDVFIWDQLLGTDYEKERTDERFRVQTWGEREIYPPQKVNFYVNYGNKYGCCWWAGGMGVSVDP